MNYCKHYLKDSKRILSTYKYLITYINTYKLSYLLHNIYESSESYSQ